jgi:hypothetical protein
MSQDFVAAVTAALAGETRRVFQEAYVASGSWDTAAQAAALVAPYGVRVPGPYGAYYVTRRGRVRYADGNGTVTVPRLSELRRVTAQVFPSRQ